MLLIAHHCAILFFGVLSNAFKKFFCLNNRFPTLQFVSICMYQLGKPFKNSKTQFLHLCQRSTVRRITTRQNNFTQRAPPSHQPHQTRRFEKNNKPTAQAPRINPTHSSCSHQCFIIDFSTDVATYSKTMRVTYLVIEYYETYQRKRICCLQTTLDRDKRERTRYQL